MAREFRHLLLTRFNTAVSYAPSAQRLDSDWLRARLVPFEQYCLPSVAAQKDAGFNWLVFLDAESPDWFKQKMESFAPLVMPVYTKGRATDDILARGVLQTGLIDAPYLISTRMDSDDAISEDHLASVQSQFRRQEREFVTFPLGLQSFHGHLYTVHWPYNPFPSLIEKVPAPEAGRFTTVFCVAHDRVNEAGPVRQVRSAPQWLQIIHSHNNESTLRGWPRLQSKSDPRFGVVWPQTLPSEPVASRLLIAIRAYLTRGGQMLRRNWNHAISAGASTTK
jgi:Putative rhamnosyl transferase